MPNAMNRNNISISILAGDEITHWTGSPAQEGGALKGIDISPAGGPPQFVYDVDDREQQKVTLESKIPGDTPELQLAYINKYAKGTVIQAMDITGFTTTCDWIISNALVKHSESGNTPSTLTITLEETGPHTS